MEEEISSKKAKKILESTKSYHDGPYGGLGSRITDVLYFVDLRTKDAEPQVMAFFIDEDWYLVPVGQEGYLDFELANSYYDPPPEE